MALSNMVAWDPRPNGSALLVHDALSCYLRAPPGACGERLAPQDHAIEVPGANGAIPRFDYQLLPQDEADRCLNLETYGLPQNEARES